MKSATHVRPSGAGSSDITNVGVDVAAVAQENFRRLGGAGAWMFGRQGNAIYDLKHAFDTIDSNLRL